MLLYVGAFWVLLLLSVVAAALWGGRDERVVAALYLAAAVASLVVFATASRLYDALDPLLIAIDVGLLVALLAVALTSSKRWPMLAGAFQAIATLGHVAPLLNPRVWRLGYQLMEQSSAYPAVLLLMFGIWQHARRTRASSGSSVASMEPGQHNSPRH